ncbi:hypothetical protein HAX54_028370 [Datura stramonium]|uniref:Uncharacterized protein n=1 Tax=Datura stramonium TaxID=4076 RepID=A0ABS8V6N0_DATST|nr:hypothetical protein [Datura stramonium]
MLASPKKKEECTKWLLHLDDGWLWNWSLFTLLGLVFNEWSWSTCSFGTFLCSCTLGVYVVLGSLRGELKDLWNYDAQPWSKVLLSDRFQYKDLPSFRFNTFPHLFHHGKRFVTGQLLIDVGSVLEVTNRFPFPVREEDEETRPKKALIISLK